MLFSFFYFFIFFDSIAFYQISCFNGNRILLYDRYLFTYFTSAVFETLLACQQDKNESVFFFIVILLENADKTKLKLHWLMLVFKLFGHK